jgi:hypothetical protein
MLQREYGPAYMMISKVYKMLLTLQLALGVNSFQYHGIGTCVCVLKRVCVRIARARYTWIGGGGGREGTGRGYLIQIIHSTQQ